MALLGNITKKALSWTGVGNALSTVGSLLSPAIGAALTYHQQKDLMEMQQNWEERMSNTAMQRHVADLEAAGINPLYGLNSGGATTPSSGLASAPDYASAFSLGNQNRLANSMNRAQVHNLETQSRLNDFNAVKTSYEGDLALKENSAFDRRLAAQLDLMHSQSRAAIQSGAASSAQASYYNSMKLGQDIINLSNTLGLKYDTGYYDWFNSHEQAKWRNYNSRAGQFVPRFGISGSYHSGYHGGSLSF